MPWCTLFLRTSNRMKGDAHHLSFEWRQGEVWSVWQLKSHLELVPSMIMNKNLLMGKQLRPSGPTWGLSFLYMYMVSSKLPWPKNTQDLKGSDSYPSLACIPVCTLPFLCSTVSHTKTHEFSLWYHENMWLLLQFFCPQAAGWESLVPWLLLRPCAEATKELLGPHSTRHKARAHLHLLGAWGRRYPSSPNTLDGTGTRRWGSLAQTIWKAWFAKAC